MSGEELREALLAAEKALLDGGFQETLACLQAIARELGMRPTGPMDAIASDTAEASHQQT